MLLEEYVYWNSMLLEEYVTGTVCLRVCHRCVCEALCVSVQSVCVCVCVCVCLHVFTNIALLYYYTALINFHFGLQHQTILSTCNLILGCSVLSTALWAN